MEGKIRLLSTMDIPVEGEIPLGIMIVFGEGGEGKSGSQPGKLQCLPSPQPMQIFGHHFLHAGDYNSYLQQHKFQKVVKTKHPIWAIEK